MNIAVILAGGTGRRLGAEIPKQYIEIAGKPVIVYSMETFADDEAITGLQIVAEAEWRPFIEKTMSQKMKEKVLGYSQPGENRQLSIWNALQDLKARCREKDVIIIHDAARPLVSERLIDDCLKACRDHDGAMAALPVKDTTYYCRDGKIESLLDRDRLTAGQAPEAFRFGKYYRANEALLPEKILTINGSTEPAILAGMDILCVPGEERNFKITTVADLDRFQQIMEY